MTQTVCVAPGGHLLDSATLTRDPMNPDSFPSYRTGRCAACGAVAQAECHNFTNETWGPTPDVLPDARFYQVWVWREFYGLSRYGLAVDEAEAHRIAEQISTLSAFLHEDEQGGFVLPSVYADGTLLLPGHTPLIYQEPHARGLLAADDPRRDLPLDVEHDDDGTTVVVTATAPLYY